MPNTEIIVFKIIVKRRTDGLYIYIVFAFCSLELRVQSESTNNFHSKTQFPAIVLQYYRGKILGRDQVFSRQHIIGTEFGPLHVKL